MLNAAKKFLQNLRACIRPRTRIYQFLALVRRAPELSVIAWHVSRERRYFDRHGIKISSPWLEVRTDSRPRVLFVMNRDIGCDPKRGPSQYFCDSVSSLETSGSGHAQHYFMDYVLRYGIGNGSDNLVRLCQKIKPDFIYYLPIQDLTYHAVNVPVETLLHLRERMKIPVMTAIGDAWLYDRERVHQTRIFSEFSDRIIIGEPRSPACHDPYLAPKLLKLWFPRDALLFTPAEGKRDIPLSFIGSVEGYADRKAGLAELKKLGVFPAYFGPKKGQYQLTFTQIADLYRRSKMTINFTRIGDSYPIRGRVWEALLSGCLLFEEMGSSTEDFFVPNVDYIPFNGINDLAGKIFYYQQHPEEAAIIAQHGMTVARDQYSNLRYWNLVFQAVEVARRN